MASELRTSDVADTAPAGGVLRALPRVSTVAEAWFHPGVVGATAIGFAERLGLSQVSRWSLQLASPAASADPPVRPPIDYWPWMTDTEEATPVADTRSRALPRASSRRLGTKGPGTLVARLRPEVLDPSTLRTSAGPRHTASGKQLDNRMAAFKRMLEATGRIPSAQDGSGDRPSNVGDVGPSLRPSVTDSSGRAPARTSVPAVGEIRRASTPNAPGRSPASDHGTKAPGVELGSEWVRRRVGAPGWRERASAALLDSASSALDVPPTAPTPRATPPSGAPRSSTSTSGDVSPRPSAAGEDRAVHRPSSSRDVAAPAADDSGERPPRTTPGGGATGPRAMSDESRPNPAPVDSGRPDEEPGSASATHVARRENAWDDVSPSSATHSAGTAITERAVAPPSGVEPTLSRQASSRIEAARALAEAQSHSVPADAALHADTHTTTTTTTSRSNGVTSSGPIAGQQPAALRPSASALRSLPVETPQTASTHSGPATTSKGRPNGVDATLQAQHGSSANGAITPSAVSPRLAASAPVGPPLGTTGNDPSASADAFVAVLRSAPSIAPRPLPESVRPLTAAIVGHSAVSMRTDHIARRALTAAGKRAATIGSVIHLERTPDPRSDRELLAHELTHVAHPSSQPRFFADERDSAEERRADEIARLVRRSPTVTRPTDSPAGEGEARPQTRREQADSGGSAAGTRSNRLRSGPRSVSGATVRRTPASPQTVGLRSEAAPSVLATSASPRTFDAGELAARPSGAVSPVTGTRPRTDAERPPPRRRSTPMVAPAAVIRRIPAPAIVESRPPTSHAPRSQPATSTPNAADAVIRRTQTGSDARHGTGRVVRRVIDGSAATNAIADGGSSADGAATNKSELAAAGIADLSSASGRVDFVDWIIEQIEFRLLSELQRRGGRFRSDF